MRILMVSQMVPYLPCYDGFRLIPANLLRCLADRHEFHLVALSAGTEAAGQLAWSRAYCRSTRILRVAASRRFVDRLARLVRPLPARLIEAVTERVESVEPDVVHLEGPALAPLAELAPAGVPVLLSAHDALSLRYREFAAFAPSRRARLVSDVRALAARRFERRWFGKADQVFVTSPSDGDALGRSVQRGRLAVIPNGVDLDFFTYGPAPEPGRIVFTGNMSWPPNADAAEFFVAEVLALIRASVQRAEFWIVGADPSPRVRSLANASGVHVTNAVADLREWVRSASVYVSPLRFGAGVKNKILEAMALGAPIVATSTSLTGTPLVHGRHLLVAESASEIARHVVTLLGDVELRRALSREARQKVELEYSWPSIATRYEAHYRPRRENAIPRFTGSRPTDPCLIPRWTPCSLPGTPDTLGGRRDVLLSGRRDGQEISRTHRTKVRNAQSALVEPTAVAEVRVPASHPGGAVNVSVVIPTYNRGRVVHEALESVLRQTYPDFEVIVVDDGSTDDTKDRLEPFLAHSRIRYIQQKNAGVAAARNTAMKLSAGKLISFLDSDDLWRPDKLEHEVAFLETHPEVQAVFSDLEKYDGREHTPSFMRATPTFSKLLVGASYPDGIALPQRDMFLCLLQEVPIKPSALTVRREAVEATGGFDESLPSSEDWEFLLRFARTARFGYIDRPLAVLRISEDSLHRTDFIRANRVMLRVFARELKFLTHDREALIALRRGVSGRSRRLGSHYLSMGKRAAAIKTYLGGFRGSRDPGLLLRATAASLPRSIRESAFRVIRRGGHDRGRSDSRQERLGGLPG